MKRIAVNRCKSFLRNQLYQLTPLDEYPDQLVIATSPDEELLKRELVDTIAQAIKTLPNHEKQVLFAFLDGLTHKEISQQLRIAPQTSMNNLSKARQRIVTSLKKSPYGVVLLPKALLTAKIKVRGEPMNADKILRFQCTFETFKPVNHENVRWFDLQQDAHILAIWWDWIDKPSPTPEEWSKEYQEGHRFCGIMDNEQLISHAGVFKFCDYAWDVGATGTHKAYQGHGYSKAVCSFVTSYILNNQRQAHGSTLEDNIAMIKVFEALGYQPYTLEELLDS